MTKVYVSQPMRGISDAKVLVLREKLFGEFQAEHPDEPMELIDSIVPPNKAIRQVQKPSIAMLAHSIEKMADADVAIFAVGWEKYAGCRIENYVARYYEIPIVYA